VNDEYTLIFTLYFYRTMQAWSYSHSRFSTFHQANKGLDGGDWWKKDRNI